MNVKIYSNTKIYIACPANAATGGPELLHQLGYHLINDLKIDVFMYYYDFNSNKFKIPVHPEYEFYNVPYVLEMKKDDDVAENIIIVPEVLGGLSLLPKFKKIRKSIWFLSVDNYIITKKGLFFQKALNKLMRLLRKPPLFS